MKTKLYQKPSDPSGSDGTETDGGQFAEVKAEMNDLADSADKAIADVMNMNAQDFLKDHQQQGGQ